MKVKDAREFLRGYSGEELYKRARELYQSETDNIIALRAPNRKPGRGDIESAVDQMKDWFRKVAEGFNWPDSGTPENIIKWENSATWVRYDMVDSEVTEYGRRTRLQILKGSPFPLFDALTPEALDAMSGMMMASIARDARKYGELLDKRKEFAKKLGKRVCPWEVEERFCERQETYSMVEGLPTNVDDLVFVCTVEKCIKEVKG